MGKFIAVISFVIFLAAFLFCGLGYGSPWWVDTEDTSVGLFQTCMKTGDSWECKGFPAEEWSTEHTVTMALMTVGLAANLAAMVLYGKSMCGDRSVNSAAGCSIGAGTFIMAAVILYGAWKDNSDIMGWSFWLAAIGGAGHIANGIVTLILECISCC